VGSVPDLEHVSLEVGASRRRSPGSSDLDSHHLCAHCSATTTDAGALRLGDRAQQRHTRTASRAHLAAITRRFSLIAARSKIRRPDKPEGVAGDAGGLGLGGWEVGWLGGWAVGDGGGLGGGG
jgi:hypothetical protein